MINNFHNAFNYRDIEINQKAVKTANFQEKKVKTEWRS